MMNNRFGRHTYVTAISSDLEPDPGGGEFECDGEDQGVSGAGAGLADKARRQGRDLQREVARKKYLFQQKMSLEGNRKILGKGNIITFLVNNSRQGIELNDVNKMLRVGGFTPQDVVTIKLNDFRLNQVEVLFKMI